MKIFFTEENNKRLLEAVRNPDTYPFNGRNTMWHRCLDANRRPICEPGEGLSYCEFGAIKAGALAFVVNPLDMVINVYLGAGETELRLDDEEWGGITTRGLGHEYIVAGALPLDRVNFSENKDETLKGILAWVYGFIDSDDIYGVPAKVFVEEYSDEIW